MPQMQRVEEVGAAKHAGALNSRKGESGYEGGAQSNRCRSVLGKNWKQEDGSANTAHPALHCPRPRGAPETTFLRDSHPDSSPLSPCVLTAQASWTHLGTVSLWKSPSFPGLSLSQPNSPGLGGYGSVSSFHWLVSLDVFLLVRIKSRTARQAAD